MNKRRKSKTSSEIIPKIPAEHSWRRQIMKQLSSKQSRRSTPSRHGIKQPTKTSTKHSISRDLSSKRTKSKNSRTLSSCLNSTKGVKFCRMEERPRSTSDSSKKRNSLVCSIVFQPVQGLKNAIIEHCQLLKVST